MKLTIYQVDAFTEKVFEGNPAAIVPLGQWLPDDIMQNIAMENNLSETAFFVPSADDFHIRWFTPVSEVNLCGHATLATAFVLFNCLGYAREKIVFQSASGVLTAKKENALVVLDFAASKLERVELPENSEKVLGTKPVEIYRGTEDLMFIFENEEDVKNLRPDFYAIKSLDTRGIIATSPSENYDFVSRFFAPAVGIDEDPVTGSAHTMLIPYWSKRLGKNQMVARQISKRGGTVYCKFKKHRVEMGGEAAHYLTGEIII